MAKLIRAPMDLPDEDLLETGLFLNKRDCEVLYEVLKDHSIAYEIKVEVSKLVKLMREVANEE